LSEKQKVESVANAAKKGRSDRKEVDRGGFFSEERTDKVLRAQIETILKDYGIDRAAWHGVTSLVTTVVC
jgi:hypothetical protein